MELSNFIIWAVVVFGVAGFAIVSMLSAFRRPIDAIPFPDGMIESPSIPLDSAQLSAFAIAVEKYRAADYRSVIEQLTPVVEQVPNCAEAWHNIALAYANVGDNNKAVRSFLKASDAYDQQATKSGIDRVRQDLERLKQL
jgi:tetratricopeptide (TPR) repeat protein